MHVNAELIIYGGTEPDAQMRVNADKVTLSKDGTFAYHFVLPDGQFHIPVEATSADGVETRERPALLPAPDRHRRRRPQDRPAGEGRAAWAEEVRSTNRSPCNTDLQARAGFFVSTKLAVGLRATDF